MVSEATVLNNLYNHEKLRHLIYFYFKDKSKLKVISKENWKELIYFYKIDSCPEQLFHFFDTHGIHISTVPAKDIYYWSFRIHTKKSVVICNDFYRRNDAIIYGLQKAIEIFDQLNSNKNGE